MSETQENACASIQRLQDVLDKLTAPDGCPWDRSQTSQSLADYVIEESHELVSAIRFGDEQEVCEELGDVFFLLLFIASLYAKQNKFTLADAVNMCSAKMIRRHPHVFADAKFENQEQQLKAWEAIKKGEHEAQGLFSSLPASLPPLIKAYRIHSKAARYGFTWPDDEEVERQVEAEWLELLEAIHSGDAKMQSWELGDMIFTLVELGRRLGIKANEALDFTTMRFLHRYKRMEELAKAQGAELTSMTLDQQDELWLKAKEEEKQG